MRVFDRDLGRLFFHPDLPKIKTRIPGPRSRKAIRELHRLECPHITYADRDLPVFWKRAKGATVTDIDGNRYIDFTSAFGVANLGHAPPVIRKAIVRQTRSLWHGTGDVHPPEVKLTCLKALRTILPRELGSVIFSSSGSEAVETALKTAFLATGRPGVISFEGSYHGLGYGAMLATHRPYFREPFNRQAKPFVFFEPFAAEGTRQRERVRILDGIVRRIRSVRVRFPIGAILIEPIQGRGGCRPADPLFLKGLRRIATREGLVLIFDEVFTGFGRTGRWFAFEHYGILPDLLCLGKGMANGFPISACVGKRGILKHWGPSPGEAKHTSTFLGNPLGCAMVIETIRGIRKGRFLSWVNHLGVLLKKGLEGLKSEFPERIQEVRGRGLMVGLVMIKSHEASRLMKLLLKKGVMILTSGENSGTLSFTPPFVIQRRQIQYALEALHKILKSPP